VNAIQNKAGIIVIEADSIPGSHSMAGRAFFPAIALVAKLTAVRIHFKMASGALNGSFGKHGNNSGCRQISMD
jgi:hypothetical protein